MKRIIFKEIKLRKNNYINNSTDKRNVSGEGIQVQQYFWKVFTWGKNSTILKKRVVLNQKEIQKIKI